MSIQMMAPSVGVATESVRKGEGLISRIIASIVAAQEIRAKRVVARQLARMSDNQLQDLGFTAEEIRAARKTGGLPGTYWD
jgi:uncharacterized protein YjiS (DUF1127 family)